MSVDKPTGIEYKLCAELCRTYGPALTVLLCAVAQSKKCQYSVPRNELVDGKCVYCVHDIPNPMWK